MPKKKFTNNLTLAFLIGFFCCVLVMPKKSATVENTINTVLKTIDRHYVDSLDVTSLKEHAIHQILENLDPHSIYMNRDDVTEASVMMAGSFEGIGVEFSIHRDSIIVINVIPNGPSEKQGIQAGQRITHINKEKVTGIGITNSDVIKKLRGKRGTVVNVGINHKHDTNPQFIDIIRDKIPLVSLDVAYEIAPKTGYIKLNRFAATTFKEFKTELNRLKEENGINKLILDLRGNSGGYLDQAVKILNEFFGYNNLLVYTEGHARKKQEYFSDFFGTFKDGDLCVLINEGSASASEIIAGAIQDHDRGFIVGERSFGKGLVQEQIPLDDGGLIRLTVSRYYTPSGRCIQKPYAENQKNYFSETYLKNQDNIVDSLEVFKTNSGRIVYGGGGIKPDYYVQSRYDSIPEALVYLYTSDFFEDLVFDYVDSHREKLSQITLSKFSIPIDTQDKWLLLIEEWGLSDLEKNKNVIEFTSTIDDYSDEIISRLSALIIRQFWGWSDMQIFLNQNDEIITTSLSLMKD